MRNLTQANSETNHEGDDAGETEVGQEAEAILETEGHSDDS